MTEGKQIYYHNIRQRHIKMNKMLRELARTAGGYVDGSLPIFTAMDQVKFTKAVVEECCRWISENVGLIDETAVADLKRHFGVDNVS